MIIEKNPCILYKKISYLPTLQEITALGVEAETAANYRPNKQNPIDISCRVDVLETNFQLIGMIKRGLLKTTQPSPKTVIVTVQNIFQNEPNLCCEINPEKKTPFDPNELKIKPKDTQTGTSIMFSTPSGKRILFIKLNNDGSTEFYGNHVWLDGTSGFEIIKRLISYMSTQEAGSITTGAIAAKALETVISPETTTGKVATTATGFISGYVVAKECFPSMSHNSVSSRPSKDEIKKHFELGKKQRDVLANPNNHATVFLKEEFEKTTPDGTPLYGTFTTHPSTTPDKDPLETTSQTYHIPQKKMKDNPNIYLQWLVSKITTDMNNNQTPVTRIPTRSDAKILAYQANSGLATNTTRHEDLSEKTYEECRTNLKEGFKAQNNEQTKIPGEHRLAKLHKLNNNIPEQCDVEFNNMVLSMQLDWVPFTYGVGNWYGPLYKIKIMVTAKELKSGDYDLVVATRDCDINGKTFHEEFEGRLNELLM